MARSPMFISPSVSAVSAVCADLRRSLLAAAATLLLVGCQGSDGGGGPSPDGTGGNRSSGGAPGGTGGQGGQTGQPGATGGSAGSAVGAGGGPGSGNGGSAGGSGNPTPSDGGGAPSAGTGARITVAAGELDRERTVVSFPLGAGEAGRSLALKDASGALLPLQVDSDGKAVFVLPALKAGAQATFTVETVTAGMGELPVRAAREPDGVQLSLGAAKVLRYQMQGKLPAGVGAAFLRGGYLHPILTPGGALVTDDYPGDHRHHHGIWSAWAHTTFEGRDIDFWNMGGRTAKVDFESVASTWEGPVHAGLRSKQVHVSLAGGAAKTALKEDWVVTLYRTHDGAGAPPYFLFDLDSTQEAASASAVMLEQYIYGGFGLRGAAGWGGGGGATFLTAEGRTRANGNATATRWCHMGGRVGAGTAGYAALGHPSNFRAPQPVRINPTDPFFSIAPVQSSGFAIEPGKPYVSRYRIVVSDGAADRGLLDRLWNDYAKPPTVTVEAAGSR